MLVYFDRTRDPNANLAREQELFHQVETGELPALVRFWVDSECLVRGMAKSANYGWYNELLANSMKVPVIVRSTGGGVVYHDEGNLNWSFFLTGRRAFVSPTKVFDEVSRYVVSALGRLGLQAKFSPPNRIDVEERKVSGMAARSTARALLVHGTLLLNTDLDRLNRLCIPPEGCPPVANLREWLPDIEPPKIIEAVTEVLRESGFDVRTANLDRSAQR